MTAVCGGLVAGGVCGGLVTGGRKKRGQRAVVYTSRSIFFMSKTKESSHMHILYVPGMYVPVNPCNVCWLLLSRSTCMICAL